MEKIRIKNKTISNSSQTYFIADIGSNHDGKLYRALDLIKKCADAGADAAKFQHFKADTIVSDYGFKNLRSKFSHQKNWKKSVYDVYNDASISMKWNEKIIDQCEKSNIAFFSSPYDFNYVDKLARCMPAFKIGSGDLNYHDLIKKIASKNKPCLLATGASNIKEVDRAVSLILKLNKKLILMQCNTNYTGSEDNFNYINLNVLKTFRKKFPNLILGLSDHTPGHSTVLGAITLGAKVIEKHFTDSNNRSGPDHKFAMTPKTWSEMVSRTRELEKSLGDGVKRVEKNEIQTLILQRRAVRLKNDIKKGQRIKPCDLVALRPCSKKGISPNYISKIINKKAIKNLKKDMEVKWSDLK